MQELKEIRDFFVVTQSHDPISLRVLGISLVIGQDEAEGLRRLLKGHPILNIEPLDLSLAILDLLPFSRHLPSGGPRGVELADRDGAIGAILGGDPEVVAAGVEDDLGSLRRRPQGDLAVVLVLGCRGGTL